MEAGETAASMFMCFTGVQKAKSKNKPTAKSDIADRWRKISVRVRNGYGLRGRGPSRPLTREVLNIEPGTYAPRMFGMFGLMDGKVINPEYILYG